MKREELFNIAQENGLQIIETTSDKNGYPIALRTGIIGFDSFAEAKALAQDHNLSLCTFVKKNGWQLWVRGEEPYKPFFNSADDYGDDYSELTYDKQDTFYEDEVKPFLDNFNCFDEIESFLEDKRELYNELLLIDEHQVVITYRGKYYTTIDRESIEWSNDGYKYVIGVIQWNKDSE